MASRYFKITGATLADKQQIIKILTSKTFYPEISSNPPLPASYDNSFDYRQFFMLFEGRLDDAPIVYTRQEWSVAQFNIQAIPIADWVSRYLLSESPTIEEVNDTRISIYNKAKTYAFLSYDYQLFNNKNNF